MRRWGSACAAEPASGGHVAVAGCCEMEPAVSCVCADHRPVPVVVEKTVGVFVGSWPLVMTSACVRGAQRYRRAHVARVVDGRERGYSR